MADRPRGSGGPEEGTAEYDWLYGSGRGNQAASDDATRVFSTQQRPETPQRPATQDGPAKPPSRPAPPPVAPAPGGADGGGRRPRFRLRWVGYAVVLWLVFLVAVPLWAWSRVTGVEAFPEAEGRPADQPGTTYLVVGSDKADDLTPAQQKKVRAGVRGGQRTDTIMLLHVGSGPNLLMSIPRDSQVDIPGHGRTKINAAFAYGGPELLIRTIEQNTGIRVDHYIEVGFGSVINMVDAVGGIEICPEKRMKDPDARLNIKKGCQEVDGTTALAYSRSRKTTGLGDIDRAKHQREVVSAVGGEVLSPWTVLNPLRWYGVNTAAAGAVVVSEGTGPVAMGRFAWAITRVTGDKGLTCGVPIRDLGVNWDAERSARMFDRIIADDTAGIGKNLCTASGLPR